jgi:hypothetical protein
MVLKSLPKRMMHNSVHSEKKSLETQGVKRSQELRQYQVEIIHRLARAAEYRDNETGMHVIRMSKLCEQLARGLGLNDHECQLLRHGSPMHDIGKIGIPDHILLKPGRLSPEEWDIMQSHAEIGALILSGSESEFLQMAEVIAGCHHEQWDGSGYPKGLKGEEIPLVARIVAICDVFDALTSDRPYKKAWSIEDTVKEMESESGHRFDPNVLKVFMDLLPEMIEISQQEFLITESLVPVGIQETSSGKRKVTGGLWVGPYTGQVITNPGELQIDHMIPLKEAHISGARDWDPQKKQDYANDLDHSQALIAVKGGANQSKGSKDPAHWMPPNRSYWYQYLEDWITVKKEWELSMDQEKVEAVKTGRSVCGKYKSGDAVAGSASRSQIRRMSAVGRFLPTETFRRTSALGE